MTAHTNPVLMVSALNQLYKNNLLNQANRNAVANHENPGIIAEAFVALNKQHLLNQTTRDAIATHENPVSLAASITHLNASNLLKNPELAQQNWNAIKASSNPEQITRLLHILHRQFVDQNEHIYWQTDQRHNEPSVNSEASQFGVEAYLFGDHFLEDDDLLDVNLTTQTALEELIQHQNILFGNDEVTAIWNNIPSHFITLKRWKEIVALCLRHQDNPEAGREAFFAYLLERLNIPRQQGEVIDGEQTTHTASIHKSSSESAVRLKERYQDELNTKTTDTILLEIKTWVNEQPNDDALAVNSTAKRCIERLTQPTSSFTDPESKITLHQLLALTWLAMHDDSQRTGILKDAKKQFSEGLYDIQRNYSLSEDFKERGIRRDLWACYSGTFNKLIERLVSIHPDAVQNYITKQAASERLPKLVLQEAQIYLHSGQASKNLTSEAFFEAIKEKVKEKLLDEFDAVFVGPPEMPQKRRDELQTELNEIIDAGQYVDLSELIETYEEDQIPEVQIRQKGKRGARKYLSLFSTPQITPDTKKEDKNDNDESKPHMNNDKPT